MCTQTDGINHFNLRTKYYFSTDQMGQVYGHLQEFKTAENQIHFTVEPRKMPLKSYFNQTKPSEITKTKPFLTQWHLDTNSPQKT